MAREQKKLSKKELREDPLMKMVVETQSWLSMNGRRVIYGAAALVVVLLVVVYMINQKQTADKDSIAALANAQQEMSSAKDPATIKPKLQEIADDYDGTTGGAQALYSLAELTLSENDNAKAAELFERFTKTYSNEYLLTVAAFQGQATALENEGQFAEAAELFDRVVDSRQALYAKPFSLLDSGRCWSEAGEVEKARDRYQQVVDQFGSSQAARDANRELARLDLEG